MTNQEFYRLTRQARDQYGLITDEVMRELLDVYLEASELVKAEVLRAERLSLSELTIDSRNAIAQQLDRGVELIREATELAVTNGIVNSIDVETPITDKWLSDAFIDAGLTPLSMANLNAVVREDVLTLSISRQFTDGYTFSERVWNSASLYKNDMTRVINLGLAQGKDNIKIAEALSVYLKDGRSSLKRANVYGKIQRGNGKIYSRISKRTDYRALRLVRSEQYMSLQDASSLRGQNNPGTTGMYNWKKNPFTAHDCVCNKLEAGSPYAYEDIPEYPHPNCLCRVIPVLRPRNEFISDLKAWADGESVPYMDKWYTEKYLLT